MSRFDTFPTFFSRTCFHFLLLFLVLVSPDRQYQSSTIIIRWMETIFLLEGYEEGREDIPYCPHIGTRWVVSMSIFILVAFLYDPFKKLTPLPNVFAFRAILFFFGEMKARPPKREK